MQLAGRPGLTIRRFMREPWHGRPTSDREGDTGPGSEFTEGVSLGFSDDWIQDDAPWFQPAVFWGGTTAVSGEHRLLADKFSSVRSGLALLVCACPAGHALLDSEPIFTHARTVCG